MGFVREKIFVGTIRVQSLKYIGGHILLTGLILLGLVVVIVFVKRWRKEVHWQLILSDSLGSYSSSLCQRFNVV